MSETPRKAVPDDPVAVKDEGPYYGNDCPQGMVQIEFVGVDPNLRHGDYGWKPSSTAFLDVWVDGKRFNIQLGDMGPYGHPGKRGMHVNYHYPAEVENRSVNALTITFPAAKIEAGRCWKCGAMTYHGMTHHCPTGPTQPAT